MRRVKEIWDIDFSKVARTAQNLIDSVWRFRKEGWGRFPMENQEMATAQTLLPKDQEIRHLEWTSEMKFTLITFDNEKRAKGRGFMKTVKERWDQYHLEYRDESCQKLRDKAARFKKESEVIYCILVRRRNKIQQEETRHDENLPEDNHEVRNDIKNNSNNHNNNNDNNNNNNNNDNDNGVVEKQADELTEDDKELERFFQIQIKAMDNCSLQQLQPRQKLPKMKLTKEI